MDISSSEAPSFRPGARAYDLEEAGLKTPVSLEPETAAELEKQWADPPGLLGRLKYVQNDNIAARIMGTAFLFFLLGGVNALLMRIQLATPESNFLTPEQYNQFFTMHGSTMMFLFAVPFLEGFAILLLPMVLGNREMPFPRLGAFSFYIFLLGGLLFYSSFLFGTVPDTGWFAYVPLAAREYSPGLGMDFFLLALGVAEVAAIAAGIEIIIAILRMRAPGMSLGRMPMLAWAWLVTAFAILFGFTPLIVGSALMEIDRKFGTRFYDPTAGGSPLLWQHLFWIFGHPEVYIQFIPAVGFISMIVPVFARRRLVAYPFVAMAVVATGFISFALWVHHMFTTGLPQVALAFFTAASIMIAIPSGVQIFAWIATLWGGRPVWRTPLLFVVGFIVLFVLGGITGVMVASIPFDTQVHDSFFVVAHFHYVLIGGVTFPIFAALYYWLPKFTGRMLSERLGQLQFWLMFIGFNLTFFPMHIVGILGMPRRVYTYQAGLGWDSYNLLSSIGAFILAAGILIFPINFFYHLKRGRPAGHNPWGADSLEWAAASPPPAYGFAVLPIVRSRHPLWNQVTLQEGVERTERMLKRLAGWPLNWRASVVTSALDAQPVEVFQVSGPSIWPFVTAVGLVTIFGAEIYTLRWLALLGGLILIFGAIAWSWPEDQPVTEEELEFEREFDIPVRRKGSRVVSVGAMWLMLLVIAIALGSFYFSYLYIRLENPAWPPEGFELPGLLLPAISAGVLLLSALPLIWAMRSIRRDREGGLKAGLALSFLLGALAVGLQVYDFTQFGFGWTEHAYASLFYLLGGIILVLTAAGLLMNALTQYWTWRGEYSSRRHTAVDNTGLYWFAMLVFWVITFGVLYLGPYLT